jgi:hypothetical protein
MEKLEDNMPTNKPPRRPQLVVVEESPTGLNKRFKETDTGKIRTRGEVADNIEQYPGYHIMKKGGERIIRSNPNITTKDNLD